MLLGSDDEALVALSFGLIYHVTQLSSQPTIDMATSQDITARFRTIFRMIGHESGRVTKEHCMQTLGAAWLDEVSGMSWLYRRVGFNSQKPTSGLRRRAEICNLLISSTRPPSKPRRSSPWLLYTHLWSPRSSSRLCDLF